MGEDWNDQQWLAKALELAETYGATPEDDPLTLRAGPADAPPASAEVGSGALRVGEDVVALVDLLERDGFGALPVWYPALDAVYDITDMRPFSSAPEHFVGDRRLAGVPGYSYVTKSAGRRTASVGRSACSEDAPSDEVRARYANRLLAASLTRPSSARA